RQLRIFSDRREERHRMLRCPNTHDQWQVEMARTRERRDDLTTLFHHGKPAALLPEREWSLLDDLHFERRRIDLAHRHTLDPRQAGDPLARLFGIEADQRRPAIQPDAVKDI